MEFLQGKFFVNQIEQHSRSAARLASVQALFQLEASQSGVERIIRDFSEHWLHKRADEISEDSPVYLKKADQAYFQKLVRGVIESQEKIDSYLDSQLAEGWTLSRLDATVRAILRAGLFEIIKLPDTPVRVIIDEYINIAHAFFGEQEPAFVNGVLDAAAKAARGHELSP